MGIQGVKLHGGAVMAASFVVGVVLLVSILQLGDAINAGRSSYRLPAARRLLNRRAQPDGADAHGALILGQQVDQTPPAAPGKFGRRVLDFSTSGLRKAPKGYPPNPGTSQGPVQSPPPPTHIHNPPPPPPY